MSAHKLTAQIAATNDPEIRRVLEEVARRRREEARRIGTRIAELRERHHLTQQAAAERMRVAYRTYQTWEAGDSFPRWHNLQKIAKAYGVTVDDILGNPPAPPADIDERLTAISEELSRQSELLHALREAVESELGHRISAAAARARGRSKPRAAGRPGRAATPKR